MALFLSESYEAHSTSTSMASLTEAALTLLDLSNAQASLTEGIMTADYILEKRNQALSEGEAMDSVKNFIAKVWAAIKSFAKTVWAKVKEIAAVILRKVKEWSARLYGAAFGKDVEISKADSILLDELPRFAEKYLFLATKGYSGVDAGKDLQEDLAALAAENTKMKAKVEAATGTVTVTKNVIETTSKTINTLSEKLTSATSSQEKQVKIIDSELESVKDKTDEAKLRASANLLKKQLVVIKDAATALVTCASALSKAVGSAKEKKEDKK